MNVKELIAATVGVLLAGCGHQAPVALAAPATPAPAASVTLPIAVPGVQEPPELRVVPYPTLVLSAPERMLAEATQVSGGAFNPLKMPEVIDAILAKYPEWGDGHAVRTVVKCQGTDPAPVLTELNRAINTVQHQWQDAQQMLFAVRAKLSHHAGDDEAALLDLDRAVHVRIDTAEQIFNLRSVSGELSSALCIWSDADLDALVAKFPTDPRAYVFRGLFAQSMANDHASETAKDHALADFGKAASLQPSAALPPYLTGHALLQWSFEATYQKPAAQIEAYDQRVLGELTRAVTIQPAFAPALAARGGMYYLRKEYRRAVNDYDALLQVDAHNLTALHEGALAKLEMNDVYGAVKDLSAAIETQRLQAAKTYDPPTQALLNYEARANAHAKAHEWDLAIADDTQAISLEVGSLAVLIPVQQFRALYPEYHSASDEVIAHKLQQTFDPNVSYTVFAQRFLHDNLAQGFRSSMTLPDLLMARADAQLKAGDWHAAQVDYRRASNGFPLSAGLIERWRELESLTDKHVYVDLKTFDDASTPGQVQVWIKVAATPESAYSLYRDELNCKTHQILTSSSVSYGADGAQRGEHTSTQWSSVIPDSLGESVFAGACRVGADARL